MDSPKVVSAEIAIGYLLRSGVILSGLLILSGSLVQLGNSYSSKVGVESSMQALLQGRELAPTMVPAARFSGVLTSIMNGHFESLIVLGLLVLIGLPIVRVVLAGVVFFIQRDYIFVLFSSIVLVNLMYGVFH